MIQRIIIFSFFLITHFLHTQNYPYIAFCRTPVADLFGNIPTLTAIGQPWDEENLATIYPRVSQLIFNEQVTVKDKRGKYSLVSIFHWFYTPRDSNHIITDYWVETESLTHLSKKEQPYIPSPISFKTEHLYDSSVVTLQYPYVIDGVTYSAGTRFKRADRKIKDDTISVKIYNKKTPTAIPESFLQHKKLTTSQEKRDLFLTLVKEWTSSSESFFPYVLGGASITHAHPNNEMFTSQIIKVQEIEKFFFYRPLHNESLPQGIDCSHLITRAAHIAQIPLFARNTTTFLKTSPSIPKNYTLQNGDFLVWKGHCCIVADVEKNLVIEARGYASGYGKVQQLPLSKIFKNVKTYKELLKKYYKKEKLYRIDKHRNIIQEIDTFLIVQLVP